MTRIAVDVRKNFYAVGDGIADDTISIQNAINSGLPVFIPPGRYKKRKQLICLQMIFFGAGSAATIFEIHGTNGFQTSFSGDRFATKISGFKVIAYNESCDNYCAIKSCKFKS